MQIPKERQRQNAEKEINGFIFMAQDGLVYESDGTKTIYLSVVCDPDSWDTPHVYPKKRKKRKKGFDREITRITHSKHPNR